MDNKGLGALWREGLLALNVLQGKTKGYKHHPQLERFKQCINPIESISDYLHFIVDEADLRGYTYNRHKLLTRNANTEIISICYGQLVFECTHLRNKILTRNVKEIARISDDIELVNLHPMFTLNYDSFTPERWERV